MAPTMRLTAVGGIRQSRAALAFADSLGAPGHGSTGGSPPLTPAAPPPLPPPPPPPPAGGTGGAAAGTGLGAGTPANRAAADASTPCASSRANRFCRAASVGCPPVVTAGPPSRRIARMVDSFGSNDCASPTHSALVGTFTPPPPEAPAAAGRCPASAISAAVAFRAAASKFASAATAPGGTCRSAPEAPCAPEAAGRPPFPVGPSAPPCGPETCPCARICSCTCRSIARCPLHALLVSRIAFASSRCWRIMPDRSGACIAEKVFAMACAAFSLRAISSRSRRRACSPATSTFT